MDCTMISNDLESGDVSDWGMESLHPLSNRKSKKNTSDGESYLMTKEDRVDPKGRSKRLRPNSSVSKRFLLFCIIAAFSLGYYAQVLVFFFHIRLGFTGEILSTREVSLTEKWAGSLVKHMRRVIFVCKKTNWDYIGFIATPHATIFAHEDVFIPSSIEKSLSIVRHSGVDSYMNLHNKTLTIMSHVQKADSRNHLMKQDEEAVIFWPHFYSCMSKCKDLSTCYAGDMHVNIGDATNSNSYIFATGGSYFLGNQLLACLVTSPTYVELDGLDFGEDKTVGKMIHYNKCEVQYVSCKWFNNLEVYSENAVVSMRKGFSINIGEDSVLLRKDEQKEQNTS